MAPAAATVRPHIISTQTTDGRVLCYVRAAHAADVYSRVEATNGRLTCTCPAGQQRQPCQHAASVVSISAQSLPQRSRFAPVNGAALYQRI